MDWNARSPRLSLVFLLTLLLLIGVVVGEDRTHGNSGSRVAGVRSFIDYVFGTGGSGGQHTDKALQAGRTFGHKRIQFMLMPMVYKMGVMMTMLAVLTVISLKGLMIGKQRRQISALSLSVMILAGMILLVLKLSAIFGKLYATWNQGGHTAQAWAPPPQPVHVHVHNSGGGGGGWMPHPHVQPAYSGWDASVSSGPPDEHYYYKG